MQTNDTLITERDAPLQPGYVQFGQLQRKVRVFAQKPRKAIKKLQAGGTLRDFYE